MDDLSVGQQMMNIEVIKLTPDTVHLLCKCGEVMVRKRNNTRLPQACKICLKAEYATYHTNDETRMVMREYTPEEERMIEEFKRSQK